MYFLIDGFLRNPVYLGETDIGNMFTCYRNQIEAGIERHLIGAVLHAITMKGVTVKGSNFLWKF